MSSINFIQNKSYRFSKKLVSGTVIFLLLVISSVVFLTDQQSTSIKQVANQPEKKAVQPAAQSTIFPHTALDQLKLSGVLLNKKKRWAVFSKHKGETKIIQVGDYFSNKQLKVLAIQKSQVVALDTRQQKRHIIRLKDD